MEIWLDAKRAAWRKFPTSLFLGVHKKFALPLSIGGLFVRYGTRCLHSARWKDLLGGEKLISGVK